MKPNKNELWKKFNIEKPKKPENYDTASDYMRDSWGIRRSINRQNNRDDLTFRAWEK